MRVIEKSPILVSIIVPVYNTGKYLTRCIQSLCSQTLNDIEIILVDDGSNDDSGNICDKFAKDDLRIKVFHTPNKGVTQARSLGVKNSKGLWILFVDSDDYLPINAVEKLFSLGNDDFVDIVLSSFEYKGLRNIASPISVKGKFNSNKYVQYLLEGKCGAGLVCRLFRRYLFTDEVFNISSEITNYEDFITNIKIALNAKSISAYPGVISYYYVLHKNSVSHKTVKVSLWDKVLNEVEITLKNKGFDKYIDIFIIRILYYYCRNKAHTSSHYSKVKYMDSYSGLLPRAYTYSLEHKNKIVKIFIKCNELSFKIKKICLYFLSKH